MRSTRKYYILWRNKVVNYLGGKCVNCSTTKKLEIDHITTEDKLYNISKRWSYKWEKQLEEINKCQLLCKKCHLLKYKPKHGTLGMYRHYKCRCSRCKLVWNSATKRWKKRLALV